MELVNETSDFGRSSLTSRLNSIQLRPGLFLQPQRKAQPRVFRVGLTQKVEAKIDSAPPPSSLKEKHPNQASHQRKR